MCMQGKRKKYMYLSMCSCCNVVSKFSLAVKRHIHTDHSQISSKKWLKKVVPIRVEERYSRSIRRSLDKKNSAKKSRCQKPETFSLKDDSAKKNINVPKFAYNENVFKGNSILCAICRKKFEGLVSYFNHLSAQDHRNVKICFKCTECYCLFPSINELLNHNQIHTDKKDLSIFKIDCVNATESNVTVTQCPYCVRSFENIEQLYLHIGDKHFTCFEITKIQVDSDGNAEKKGEETDLLSYKCNHCPKSLHALSDFLQHISDKHSAHKLPTVRLSRKRILPKWRRDDTFVENVKRSKSDQAAVRPNQNGKLNKPGVDKRKGNAMKVIKLIKKSEEKHSSVKETVQTMVKPAALKPVVVLKRFDEDTDSDEGRNDRQYKKLKEETSTGNKKKKSSENKAENIDHDYFEREKLEIKNEEELEGGNGDKTIRKSALHDQSQGSSYLTEFNEEDLAGDSDDDYIDEMESGRIAVELKQNLPPEKISCQYCGSAEFTCLKSLERHIKCKHPHACAMSVISKTVNDKSDEAVNNLNRVSDLVVNIKEENADSSHEKIEKMASDAETDSIMSVSKFKCPFCEFYLYHREYVFSHMQKVHSEIEHFTAGDIVKETIRVRQSEVNRECFHCPDCDFISGWKSHLLHHIRYKHSDKLPIKNVLCSLPDLYFKRDAALAKLSCPNCKIIVDSKDTLERHMREHMDGEPCQIQYCCSLPEPEAMKKPCKKLISFLCPYCDAVFTRKDSLKSHKCSENVDVEKFIPVIKCVLMKPVDTLEAKRKGINIEHAETTRLENDNINKQTEDTHDIQETVDSNLNVSVEASVLRNGTYICPVCDDFTTLSKDQAVSHVAINHRNKLREVDLLYILEAFLDKKETAGYNDEEGIYVRCKSCDFSSDNLTDTLRHTKKHENNDENREIVQDLLNTRSEGTVKAFPVTLAVGNVIIDNLHLEDVTVKPSAIQGVESRKAVSLLGVMSQPIPVVENVDRKCRTAMVKEKEIMSNYRFIKIKGEKADGTDADHVVTVVKFKCPFCAFYLYHKEYVYSHIQKIHAEVEHFTAGDVVKETLNLKEREVNRECFKCPHCSFISKWKNMFLHHFRCNHSAQSLGTIPCILPVSDVKTEVSTEKLTCPICKTICAGKDSLGRHMVDHLSGKPCTLQVNGCLPEPEALTKPLKKLVSWLCPYCDLVFTRKDSVKSHLGTHLEDTSLQQSPIIKCVLIKPTLTAGSGIENLSVDQAESVKLDNTVIAMQKSSTQHIQKKVDAQVNQTKLRGGTYICPICDNFKTLSKDQAVMHMEVNHRNRIPEVDIVYVLEALLERKETGFCVRCEFCDYSADNLTDVVRHVRTLGSHTESRNILKVNNATTGGIQDKENTKPTACLLVDHGVSSLLFEIVSLPSATIGSAEEIYVCWQCVPKKICKTRKYFKQHVARNHSDSEVFDVNLVMNEMMNSLDGVPVKGFKCTLCLEQKEGESELVQHFKDKHPDRVPQIVYQLTSAINAAGTVCEICHARCSDNVSLRKHLLLHINRRRTHCPTCGIYFETSAEVATHSSIVHSKSSHMCNICGKVFMKNKDFLRHMRGHVVDATSNKVLCQHCGTEVMKHSFKRHLLRFHAIHLTCDCEICTKQVLSVGKKPVRCKLCNIIFCTSFMLNAHNRRAHPKLRIHRDSHGRVLKECRCVNCDMVFESIMQLHGHKCHEAVDGQSKVLSLDPDKFEVSDSEYDAGEKITADISADVINENFLEFNGSPDLPYSCRLCHKSFKIKKYLYNHVRRKHADDESKRYRCKICKMSFDRMNALKRHCKFHIGLRPHQCNVCKRSFKTVSQMKEHMRIHTEKLNPKLTCKYCERKFIQSGALMAHVMYHCKLKPFICPYCQKGYASSGELRRHMDRYLDDESVAKDQFVCSYCRKNFPNKRFLMKHFYKHSPENPFHCTVCQKRFCSFQQMYTHKDKTGHFTVEEVEEAKAELHRPAGNFKPMDERKELWNKRKVKGDTETAIATSVINKDLDIQGQQPAEPIFDDQGYVEVEISNNVDDGPDETTKVALSLFENNVLQSMFEIEKPENETEDEEKFYQQNQFEYIDERVPDYQLQSAVTIEETSKEREDMEQNESFNMETGTENVSELATIVAQNIQSQETGQTQVYQTPDGSVIHVCVIKSNRQ